MSWPVPRHQCLLTNADWAIHRLYEAFLNDRPQTQLSSISCLLSMIRLTHPGEGGVLRARTHAHTLSAHTLFLARSSPLLHLDFLTLRMRPLLRNIDIQTRNAFCFPLISNTSRRRCPCVDRSPQYRELQSIKLPAIEGLQEYGLAPTNPSHRWGWTSSEKHNPA